MKLSSHKAKELLAVFRGLKPGQSFPVPSPIPGLDPTEAQAFLIERIEDKWWQFELYWNGIKYAEVTAEIAGNELLLEGL